MTKPTILIIGAAGNNGTATLEALTRKHKNDYVIRAGVRSEAKAKLQMHEKICKRSFPASKPPFSIWTSRKPCRLPTRASKSSS